MLLFDFFLITQAGPNEGLFCFSAADHRRLRFILPFVMNLPIIRPCICLILAFAGITGLCAQSTLSEFMRLRPETQNLDSTNRVQIAILWPDTGRSTHWRNEEFGNPATYYYPASLVKWPVQIGRAHV